MDVLNDISSDEDFELINQIIKIRKPYKVRKRPDHFAEWDDQEFYQRFRLSKRSVIYILEMIEEVISHRTQRNNAIPAINQLLMTLRFYASGCMIITVADFGGVSKTTACVIIKRVTQAIAALKRRFIYMPEDENEIQEVYEGFYKIARFPRVLGTLDCTHVRIQSPGGNNAEYFRNRKNYFSLNIQAISDFDLKIRDIVARWPGSAHDSNIFNNSQIKARFENKEFQNALILGDSGYPVKPYLITPLLQPNTEAENIFNESQIRTRNVIERTFGVWKRRFPVLAYGLRVKVELVQDIVVATAVLHNIARLMHEPEPPFVPDYPDDDEINAPDYNGPLELHDDAVRSALIHNYFAML